MGKPRDRPVGLQRPNGPEHVWFAFHADDADAWASGWAIDNPLIQIPTPAANYIDFYVFLDDAFVGFTTETNWNYAPLTYGIEYTASVAARYSSGLSAKDYYTFLCKYLIPPRNLVGNAPDDAAILYWQPPLEGGVVLTVVSDEARTEFPNVNTEYSPRVRQVEGGVSSRDFMDFQFAFATANNSGEAGAESDGDFFYTSMWNGTGFQKYNLDGSYVGAVSAGSVGSIRDMAWDPTTEHMFGGAGATTVFEWDMAGNTYGSFTAPTAVRAIAYDDIQDGFWANNWGTTITLFDKTGTQLNSFSPGAYASIYGFAFDYWNDGGPYLWAFTQDGSGNLMVQYEIASGTATGYTLDVTSILQIGAGIAGGLFSHGNVFGGTVTLGGNSQNDTFFGYELFGSTGPVPGAVPENLLGYNIYRDGDFVNYVAHVGGDEVRTTSTKVLHRHIYAYTVTAVYDLTPYGFPGETGESMEEGPAMVVVDYCFDLEFMETWSLGNFDANNWNTDGANWTINGQAGQPAPAAEFTWDPIVSNYEIGPGELPAVRSRHDRREDLGRLRREAGQREPDGRRVAALPGMELGQPGMADR